MNQAMVRFYSTSSAPSVVDPNDIHVFAVQGHPEFTKSVVTKILTVRSRSGVVDAVTAEEAWTRMDDRNDGVEVVGKAIWKVLGVSV